MTKSSEVLADAAETPEAGLIGSGFVGIPEAARFLSLSRSKLYQMMDNGQLMYAKFGRSRRIPRRALMQFAERCLLGAGA
jgi:excisionase family DNA binding protein